MEERASSRESRQTSSSAAPELGPPQADSALWALAGVALHFGVQLDRAAMARELALGARRCDVNDLLRAAASAGLEARLLSGRGAHRLETIARPAILRMHDGQYVILGQRSAIGNDVFYCEAGHPVTKTTDELAELWSGDIIVLARGAAAGPDTSQGEFGLRWFLPSVWRYRQTLAHVLLASIFVQLCALTAPLLFQVVIDKVLVHYSVSTLMIAVAGLVVVGLFEVWLQYLRSYAIAHTSSRIDMELGSRVFAHLLKLPMSYFETHATGQITARLREIETIREFLTGQGVTSLIDMVFAVVILGVLVAYSPRLTLIVAISIAGHIAIATSIRPRLREKTKRKFSAGAANQQFLVESVSGMGTLKAAAIEASLQSQWDERLASFIKISFEANTLGLVRQSITQFVSKLATAAVLLFGSELVIAGEMTVGALIAFNMLASLIAAPLLRLSGLWQDLQQVRVSVARLADIMAVPGEAQAGTRGRLPPLLGAIGIRNVVFRYGEDSPEVLHGFSLDLPAGQVLGIVGPSGSGKSTLTKLVQRLYTPQQGQITIDGVDIARMHPTWLRQQIGTVLQENLLFNRTIHDNIALAAPHLTREQVVAAARLAGADEFISKFPRGYDTYVRERGTNLSGGQRQRIAIARALTRNPRILILDEATSAIDYESERIVQNNLREIVRGRTVIIIAHRVAAVRSCDRIISMVEGKIVEDGTHDELIRCEGGLYRNLWAQQSHLGRV